MQKYRPCLHLSPLLHQNVVMLNVKFTLILHNPLYNLPCSYMHCNKTASTNYKYTLLRQCPVNWRKTYLHIGVLLLLTMKTHVYILFPFEKFIYVKYAMFYFRYKMFVNPKYSCRKIQQTYKAIDKCNK